ncbi:MAG: DUF4412 domain-containing protein [Flavobacteriaceae bacterium]|nr:DUF4412 domain-containing protein [Flavobacteriaceae bacterium]
MKNTILLFIALLSLNVSAQKELNEGSITLKMTMSTDNEQAKAALAMMGDITVTSYFKDDKSRTEQSHEMTGSNISIVDDTSKKILVLMDNPMMGKKYTESDVSVSDEDLKNITVTSKGDTKSVAGYLCKGYDVSIKKNDAEIKMVMYVTDKITAPNQNTAALGDKINGYPLFMIIYAKQGPVDMEITMEATEVKAEQIDDSKFDMTIPNGYSKITPP